MASRSIDRIVTSHTGSLPRPPNLIEMITRRERGEQVDLTVFETAIRRGVEDVVHKQSRLGIDIVSDGEQGKPSYATYIKDRASGFGEGLSQPIRVSGEERDFPDFFRRRAEQPASQMSRPICVGPIAWKDFDALLRDVDNLAAAMKSGGAESGFMTAPSPGIIAFFLENHYYDSEDSYLEALSTILQQEYETIASSGLELQVDCPDLAGTRQSRYADVSLTDFRKIVARNVELINEATKRISPEQMRMHICWGNYEGPHHLDVAFADIADLVLACRPQVISIEAANPRHGHEWAIWKDIKLPEDKVLMPGVIDSTTNFVEHPQLVADRLVRLANLIGKERVIAGTDCGFGTNADLATVDSRIAWAKLEALVQGASLASKVLW